MPNATRLGWMSSPSSGLTIWQRWHLAATLGVSAVAQVPTIPGAWHIPKNGALNWEKLRFEWEILRALLETYMNIYDNI